MRTLIAMLILALPVLAYGQPVKCVPKTGSPIYAMECPPGTTEQKTGIRSTPGTAAPSSSAPQKSLTERDAAFKKRMIEQQEAQQKADKEAAEARQRSEACESAQGYLRAIESGQRLSRTDPKTGERVFLDDAERSAEAAQARQRIEQTCR